MAAGLVVAALVASSPALAHRSFLVPSSTVVSGPGQWVTVDAARGNDLFQFNHNAMPIEGLVISAPDGQRVAPVRVERFRYRSVLDVELVRAGTWRIAVVDEGLRANWEQDGKPRRWTGSRAGFATAVPAKADKLAVIDIQSRVEVFVTAGQPTPIQPTGRGLEVEYSPHPNDLVAGQTMTLRFLVDGKSAPKLAVKVIPGGARYRDAVGEIDLQTDADGRTTLTWPAAGLYWLQAAIRYDQAEAPATRRLVSYAATLEVLPD